MRKLSLLAGAANGVMCLLVALYGSFIIVLMHGTVSLPVFGILSAALFALCLGASKLASVKGVHMPKEPAAFDHRVFLLAGGFSLAVSLVYLFAFFPGGFSSDTTTQWHQLRGELPLSDWHPALHTMLLWLTTRICRHPALVLLVQGAAYACAVGYAAMSMHKWRVPKAVVLLAVLYLSANPAISNIMAFPWKDCAFAIATLFLGTALFEIHFSRGEWLKNKLHPFFLSLLLALCAVLRHNGIALSLAAGVWLVISIPALKKRAVCCVILAAACFTLIKGPLYSAAGVEKNATPLDETIGLPMTVLSHVYVGAPDSLSDETRAFLETMAPREVYIEHHRTGDWNETKWFVSSLPADHGYTLSQVFIFAAGAAIKEPTLALEALGGLLDMPLLPAGDAYWRMTPYVDPSAAQFGVEEAHQPFLSRALNWLCRLTASPALSWLFWRPGAALLLIMLFCVGFARRRPLTALLLPASVICYHLATSVMLSSPTDFRFFLPTMLLWPLAIAALFMQPAKD